ncbi:acyltransferase family protein [Bradyrhizobium sp. HKCCYLS3077]|uniref:acyltransferase family protein n=1 Tax=Bradyrhizobium sp. HKCCYLS3077 TaxID=3420761 RepID=UPI003EBA2CA8
MIQPHREFWPVLGGLRFLLAMWVLFDHTYNFGPAERAIPVLTRSGLMAVMCFFVISGFSIHHSIAMRPEGYLRRRLLRILPLNALAVGIGWFGWSVLGLSGGYGTPPVPPSVWQFIGCLLLLEAFLPIMIGFLYPAWSLSIEAVYYLLAPLFRKLEGRPHVPALMIASSVLFVAWPLFRNEYVAGGSSYWLTGIVMLWAWLAGWIAYAHPGHRRYLVWLGLAGLASIATQARFFDVTNVSSAAVNAVAWIGTLMLVFYRIGKVGGRVAAMFDYLGEISFPLYILHYPVLFVVSSSLFKAYPDLNSGVVHVVISLTAAVLAYHLVDKPLRKPGAGMGQAIRAWAGRRRTTDSGRGELAEAAPRLGASS